MLLLRRSRPAPGSLAHRTAIVLRWPIGLSLVAWQYMWRTTPIHRSESEGDDHDRPPLHLRERPVAAVLGEPPRPVVDRVPVLAARAETALGVAPQAALLALLRRSISGVVNQALDCLARGTNCGSFRPPRTYPGIRGAMTWSINWDVSNGNQFANTVRPHLNTLP